MTQRRRSKKTEVEPRRFGRRSLSGWGPVPPPAWARGCGCAAEELCRPQDKAGKQQQNVNNPALPAGEWRAVWISYLEWALLDFSTAGHLPRRVRTDAGRLCGPWAEHGAGAGAALRGRAVPQQPVPMEPPVHRGAGGRTPALTRWTSSCRRPTGGDSRWKRG